MPSMPQTRVDWKQYDEWSGTDADFARSIGMDPNNFAQHKRRHLKEHPTSHGNLPAIPSSQPIAVPSPYIAVPSPSIATELDDLKARLSTVEAFIAAMQADHRSLSPSIAISSQPIAVHRDGPWVSRGLQMAPDMLAAIDAYAEKHRLEKRAVLDLALRTFFAEVGQEVGNDA